MPPSVNSHVLTIFESRPAIDAVPFRDSADNNPIFA